MVLLDLFCSSGGAAMGYYHAGFDVVGVDNKPQPRYPFEFHQADAFEFLREHGCEFDVIHASPPCQRYSNATPPERRANHPDLIAATRDALVATGKPFVIENVAGARRLLHNPVMLCGSMFGLPIWRHRYFEMNIDVCVLTPPCNHSFAPILITGTTRRKGYRRVDSSVAIRRHAIGIDWMSDSGLDEAIPPAFTEFIGRLILNILKDTKCTSGFIVTQRSPGR